MLIPQTVPNENPYSEPPHIEPASSVVLEKVPDAWTD